MKLYRTSSGGLINIDNVNLAEIVSVENTCVLRFWLNSGPRDVTYFSFSQAKTELERFEKFCSEAD